MDFQIYVRKNNPILKWPAPQVSLFYSKKDLAPSELEILPLFISPYV